MNTNANDPTTSALPSWAAALKERHEPVDWTDRVGVMPPPYIRCLRCWREWPCDTARSLAALERALGALAVVEQFAAGTEQGYSELVVWDVIHAARAAIAQIDQEVYA